MKKTRQKPVSVKKMIEAEIERQLPNMPRKIESVIHAALLSLIGVEQRGSRMEIDHCNGRHSVLTEAFKRLAQVEAEKLARTYKPSTGDIASFRTAFAQEYNRSMRRALSEIARDRATSDVKAYVEDIKISVEKTLGLKP